MKKKLLRVAERILSGLIYGFAFVGMFVFFISVAEIITQRELTNVETGSLITASLFLTGCLKVAYKNVRYQIIELLGEEIEKAEEQADELYEHLEVKIW
jgi:hypothetical protein